MILQLNSPPVATPDTAASPALIPSMETPSTDSFDLLMQQATGIGMDAPTTPIQSCTAPAQLITTPGSPEDPASSKDSSSSEAVAALLPPVLPTTWQIPATMVLPMGLRNHDAHASTPEAATSTPSTLDTSTSPGLTARSKPSPISMAIESAQAPTGAQSHDSTRTTASPISPNNIDGKAQESASSASTTGTSPAWTGWMANLSDRLPSAPSGPHAPLPLNASHPEQWREPLLNTLGERVQWHVQKGLDQAVIRLDPPHLGRVDIVIRQAEGVMQVQLSATHHEVAQQLHSVSGGLQQELSLRHTTEVNVQVSDQSRGSDPQQGQGRRQRDEPARQQPGRALSDTGESLAQASAFSMQAEQG